MAFHIVAELQMFVEVVKVPGCLIVYICALGNDWNV